MTIQDFMLEGKKAFNAYLRENEIYDMNVSETEVVKANDIRLRGLKLKYEADDAGRAVYLDDLYDRHLAGEPADRLMDEVVRRCIGALAAPVPPSLMVDDLTFSRVSYRLSVRLLSARNNRSFLKDIPYIDAGCGLVLIAAINNEPSISSEWRITVTNGLLEKLGCSREELLSAALLNTMNMEPPVLMKMSEVAVEDLCGDQIARNLIAEPRDETEMDSACVLTNASRHLGASVLFYPGMMQLVSDIIGNSYYVIPSSIHEMIIIPDNGNCDGKVLRGFLCSGNHTVVDEEDILSYDVYYYDAVTKELTVAP